MKSCRDVKFIFAYDDACSMCHDKFSMVMIFYHVIELGLVCNGKNTSSIKFLSSLYFFYLEISAFWAVLANQSIRKHGFGITRKLAKENVQLLIRFGKLKLVDMLSHHYRVLQI